MDLDSSCFRVGYSIEKKGKVFGVYAHDEQIAKVPQIEKNRTVAKQMARLERGPA